MSDFGGWLWMILGLIGVGGLGLAIAYGSILWSHRRKKSLARQRREEAVREIYKHGG
jgi:hypothetical protein